MKVRILILVEHLKTAKIKKSVVGVLFSFKQTASALDKKKKKKVIVFYTFPLKAAQPKLRMFHGSGQIKMESSSLVSRKIKHFLIINFKWIWSNSSRVEKLSCRFSSDSEPWNPAGSPKDPPEQKCAPLWFNGLHRGTKAADSPEAPSESWVLPHLVDEVDLCAHIDPHPDHSPDRRIHTCEEKQEQRHLQGLNDSDCDWNE